MSQFTTTVETMEQASRHVFTVNDAVQGDLSSLRGRLAPLAGSWQGDAFVTFNQLMERWDTNARSLNEALRGIGEAVQISGRSYDAQEQENASSMSRISSTLTS